ncbi:type II toxin-antitoxin system RelE/ParE family toxin [Candidatus Woesearchaeota archaeon]|nr:type II toxin-antitoxin system RelE/ParE family toxin [Candidatus Woesearchaeota archaeon]
MYELIFTDKAKKQFLKLEKQTQERIGSVLERIKLRPEHFVEKLIGELGYRLRVGDYRIILDIDKNRLIILILKVGHRKNVYDNL